MTKLEEARVIIQNVDLEMIELFKKRMVASKLVAEYKKENQLPILDEAREKFLIEKNLKSLNDETLESYYMTFFKGVLDSSKDYQKDLNR